MKITFNRRLVAFSLKTFTIHFLINCKHYWKRLINYCIFKRGFKSWMAIFVIGLLNFLASTPISLIIILPLTFGSLFYILDGRKNEKIISQIAVIFWFLLGHFVGIFWWLCMPLTLFKMFWPLIPFALLGIPFVISLLFLVFFSLGLIIWNKFYKNHQYDYLYFVVIFCICWFFADYIRGHFILGGFPWMLFGHFIPYAYLIHPVRWIGIDLYSIFVLLLTLTPYLWVCKKSALSRKVCITILSLWAINGAIGLVTTSTNKDAEINANIVGVQVNEPAGQDSVSLFKNQYFNQRMNSLHMFSHSKKPTIMLMPESSINETLYSSSNLASFISNVIPNENSIMLLGGLHMDGVPVYNAIYSLTNAGEVISVYKKKKLVPFGEYIPFRNILPPKFIKSIIGYSEDLAVAKDEENDLFTFYRDLPTIYPIVCYESIFPELVIKHIEMYRNKERRMSEKYKKENNIKSLKDRGEIIVNLVNDIWMRFGFGAHQHFLMSRFLAVRTGVPVVRLSNNGISAIINKHGVVIQQTKLNKKDILFYQSK